jgi:hypothetical protein
MTVAGPTVTVHASLEDLPEAARHLLRDAGWADHHASLAWYETMIAHGLRPWDRVRIYVLWEGAAGEAPVTVLPLRAPVVSRRRLGPVGLASLSNLYTTLFGPVLSPATGDPAAGLTALMLALCRERPRWEAVRLGPLPKEGPVFPALVEGLRQGGMAVQTFFSFANWFLPVGGRSFREYVAGLPSALRHTLERKERRLLGSGRTRLRLITGGDELPEAVAAYEQVFGRSWKADAPSNPEFVRALFATCARQGWLRLGLLEVDGVPAAVQCWIVSGRTASIFRLAYDERFADLSPGTVLTAHLMRRALDQDRVEEVEYGMGDDDYKRDWMSHRRERWSLLALNPRTVRGLLGVGRHLGGRGLKRLLLSLWPGRRDGGPLPPRHGWGLGGGPAGEVTAAAGPAPGEGA